MIFIEIFHLILCFLLLFCLLCTFTYPHLSHTCTAFSPPEDFDWNYRKHFGHLLNRHTGMYMRGTSLSLARSSVPIGMENIVDEVTLVSDVMAVLQGIPSSTFSFSDVTGTFTPIPCRLVSSGVRSLLSLLSKFAFLGSTFRMLDEFSEYLSQDANAAGGRVRQVMIYRLTSFPFPLSTSLCRCLNQPYTHPTMPHLCPSFFISISVPPSFLPILIYRHLPLLFPSFWPHFFFFECEPGFWLGRSRIFADLPSPCCRHQSVCDEASRFHTLPISLCQWQCFHYFD